VWSWTRGLWDISRGPDDKEAEEKTHEAEEKTPPKGALPKRLVDQMIRRLSGGNSDEDDQ